MILYKIVTTDHIFGKRGDVIHLTINPKGCRRGIHYAIKTVTCYNLTQGKYTPWGDSPKQLKVHIKQLKKIKIKI